MVNLVFVFFCLLGVPLGIGLLIGWLRWGRQRSPRLSSGDEVRWLLVEIDREPLLSTLTSDQRDEIRMLYAQATPPPAGEGDAPDFDADETGIDESADAAPNPLPADATRPVITSAPAPHERPISPLAAPAQVERRPARDPLDPAALLLYAGAFLIAAAGVVYSAYNWADLVAWQKLGMLAALTIAFAVVGWLLLGNARLKQAGETFIAISAMLIPANAIAAWSVVQDREASTGLIVLVGATITGVVYGAYSIRPGGTVYSLGAPLLGWLAIGAIPAALGFFWGWGSPLVILGVGLGRIFGQRLPEILAHLRQPLVRTGLVAAGLALLVSPAGVFGETGWLAPATFGAATASLTMFAMRSQRPIWGIGSTLAGLATISSCLFVLEVESPWVLAPLLTVLAVALVAIGEVGPRWLRFPPVRVVLQIEAVLVGLVAVGAAGEEDGLRLAVITVGVVLTAAIAYLRQERWVLLATGAAIVLWAVALAAIIAPDGEWSTRVVVLYAALWAVLLAVLAKGLDQWSHRTGQVAWGVPLWVTSAVVAVWTNLFPFNDESLATGDRIWILLTVVNLVFLLLALVASETVSRPGRLVAGGFGVVTAICAAASLDLAMADRLPTALLVLGLVALVVLGWDRWRAKPSGAWSTYLAMTLAGGLVMVAMVYLALGYLATTIGLNWVDEPGVRWTWITYTVLFGVVAIGTGMVSFRPVLPTMRALTGSNLRSVLVGLSTGFLLLTALVVARMLSADSRVLVLTAMATSWVVFGAAVVGQQRFEVAIARPWTWAGVAGAILAVGLVVVRRLALDQDGRELLALGLVSLAGMLATLAWNHRDRRLGMLASAVAMAALLISISTREPENVLAYSLPLGLYLLALGTVARREPALRDGLLGAGSGVLLLPVLWLAQDKGSVGYLGLAAGMAPVLFFGGIGLRLRVPIAAGVIGMSLIVLRLLLDAVLALQSWVSLLIVGLVLLGAGTAALVWKDALRERLERIQRGWHDLG